MANELVKKEEGNVLSLNFGSVQLDGLTEQQQNELKYLVARKTIELAVDLKQRQIKLEASTAELSAEINEMERAKKAGLHSSRSHGIETATGSGSRGRARASRR